MVADPLLEVRGLRKTYARRGPWRGARPVEALAGVDLSLCAGASLALVGPSGSGKSTLARCIAGLESPTAGEIRIEGRDLLALRGRARQEAHRRVQLVLQDSATALNPRWRAVRIVAEPLHVLGRDPAPERRRSALAMMERVGLSAAFEERRPFELSGGERQRLALARALVLQPRLLILDEALAGLDVSIQAQMLGLLRELQTRHGLTYVHVSHDLALMSVVADEVAVLGEGRIVERGPAGRLFAAPQHPQTRALALAAPLLPELAPPAR